MFSNKMHKYFDKIEIILLFSIILINFHCTNHNEINLISEFPQMFKNREDVSILFGTPDQTAAVTRGFSIDEFHNNRHSSWLNGKNGTFDFYLAEHAKVSLLITVRPFVPPGKLPQRFSVYCNEKKAGEHVVPLGWSDQFYPLPTTAVHIGWNRIELECDRIYVPTSIKKTPLSSSGDQRRLCLSFEKILIIKQSFSGQSLPQRNIFLSKYKGKNSIFQNPGTAFSTYRLIAQKAKIIAKVTLDNQLSSSSKPLIFKITATTNKKQSKKIEKIVTSSKGEQSLILSLDKFSGKLLHLSFTVIDPSSKDRQSQKTGIWKNIILSENNIVSKDKINDIPNSLLKKNQNIIVLLIDTFRRNSLGCYGNPNNISPEIDYFSKKSLLFQKSRAQASWTRPSVASLFTGLLPEEHGVLSSDSVLPFEIPRYETILKDRGYSTAAVSANPQISNFFGFAYHFDYFEELFGGVKPIDLKPELLNQLLNFESIEKPIYNLLIGENSLVSPFFMYIHVMDPHSPYNPPQPYSKLVPVKSSDITIYKPPPDRKKLPSYAMKRSFASRTLQKYYGEIRYTDHEFGKLYRLLKKHFANNLPLIVITGDHGEEFWEHGGMGHGRWLFEETLRVPIILGPFKHQQIATSPFEVRNIMSHLLNYSLSINNKGDKDLYFADELAENGTSFWHSVFNGKYKCIIRTRKTGSEFGVIETHLFNIIKDPNEQKELAGTDLFIEKYLVEQILKRLILSRKNGFQNLQKKGLKINKTILNQLKVLGYTS